MVPHILTLNNNNLYREIFNVTTDTITPKEFTKYVVDQSKRSLGVHVFNPHWRPMYLFCHHCYVKYDIIGKIETYDQDMEFLANNLKLSVSCTVLKAFSNHRH
jgi:3-isopropylmalate dehydratase small subunit